MADAPALATHVDKWKHARADSPPPQLYHYTTVEGLMGILGSEHVFATHASFVNDPMELRYGVDLIAEVIQSRAQKCRLSRAYNLETPEALLEMARQWLQDNGVYIACFCKGDDLLSQWRGYGSSGSGYCIGFDTGQLPNLRRVIYERAEQVKLVEQWCDNLEAASGSDAFDRFRKSLTSHKDFAELAMRVGIELFGTESLKRKVDEVDAPPAAPQDEEPLELAMPFLVDFAICFKDAAYAREEEWRIVQFGDANQKFRARGGMPMPYVELPVGAALRSITHGPTLDPDQTGKSVRLFLSSTRFGEIPVRRSAIAYRNIR